MSDGLTLVIDTAFARCAVGVFDGGADRLLHAVEPRIEKGHAEHLFPTIAAVLNGASREYGDLARIAVTVGPGSFTGVRVGVAAARGLALALDIPVVGVDTLEALAAPRFNGHAAILAAVDARHGNLYAGLYGADGRVRRAPAALAVGDLAGATSGCLAPDLDLELVGSGSAAAFEALTGGGSPARRVAIERSRDRIDLAALARRAALAPDDATCAKPLYLRGAEAKPASRNAALFAR